MGTRVEAHRRHRVNLHRSIEGRSSRVYDEIARRMLRGIYRRIAEDIVMVAPMDATVHDVGTGPGVLLAEVTRGRADLRLTGIDLSADMAGAAARNLREFGGRATAGVADVTDLPFPWRRLRPDRHLDQPAPLG